MVPQNTGNSPKLYRCSDTPAASHAMGVTVRSKAGNYGGSLHRLTSYGKQKRSSCPLNHPKTPH
eukprot:965319-Pelagomonas_calceolata.AAC.1